MQHGAVARYQKIQFLDHIQEDLILPMLDALRSPGDGIRQCLRRARSALQAIAFLCHNPKYMDMDLLFDTIQYSKQKYSQNSGNSILLVNNKQAVIKSYSY